jgi:3-methyladenine DNA glycosylase AlkC
MPEKLLLKDQLFNKEKVTYLSNLLKKAYPKLNETTFKKDILNKFPELELKERIYWITRNLEKHLPKDYQTTINILLQSLKEESEGGLFIFASYSDYVEANGCNKEHLELSLNALGEFTKYCSAEFAIRDFINKYPKETFQKIQEWSKAKNFHQRRLASEGLRPKLPWAKGITIDYKKATEILDNLFYDKERYVTRSVANHLNDISKIDPNFVLEILGKWEKLNKQNPKEMKYIIQHSLRTSVKRGHIETFNFLGYNSDPKIMINNLNIKRNKIVLGEAIEFSFNIIGQSEENLIIDYKIIYPTPSNRHSEKVFKIKTTKIKNKETIEINKRHPFKKMTTKKLYSGNYKLEIQINGKIFDSTKFSLEV